MIRSSDSRVVQKPQAITLETIRAVAETGVDYISSSAPITQSTWLDLSMKIDTSNVMNATLEQLRHRFEHIAWG